MKKKLLGILIVGTMGATLTGCASWDRMVKDVGSEMSGGLQRHIVVYNSTGEVILEQEGKFDIKYSDQNLQYIDEKNKKHNIYIGYNATVVVDEV